VAVGDHTFTPERHPLRSGFLGAFGVVAASGAALGLAWFMHFLIHSSQLRLAEAERTQMLDFVRVKRSEITERKDRKPERPPISQAPDAPPAAEQTDSNGGQQLAVSVSAPTEVSGDIGLDRSGFGIASGDGDYLPIVKVAPVYPRRALSRKLTGQCLVRYTVTTAGTVRDVEVVEGQCSDQIFAQPSVEAALRFKYKPRVIDGVAIEVRGVHNMFYFDLMKEDVESG
jgi:protein TonB